MMKQTYLFCSIALACLSCQSSVADINGGKDILDSLPEANSTYVLQSNENIESYSVTNVRNRATLYMAKGESEHFQIVITTGKKGSLSCVRENPVSGLDGKVYEIREFNGKDDVLVPCLDKAVKTTTKIVKLWATYSTARDLPAGDYQDIITFSGSAGEYKIGVNIHVYDVDMPIASALPTLVGINTSMIDNSTKGEDLLAKRREVSDMLLQRRFTPYFCTWWGGTMQVQCSTSPYEWDDKRTVEYLSDPRLTHVLMPNINMSADELRSSTALVKDACPDKIRVYYLWDEPADVNTYAKIKTLAADVHSADPDAKVITTFYCGPANDNNNLSDILSVWEQLSGATSFFSTSTWMLGPAPTQRVEAFTGACGNDEEWWTYVCMSETPGLAYNSTGFQNRAVSWRSFFDGNKGFLYWAANAFSSLNPLRSRSELPAGDGILVYPGTPFGADNFLPAIRLERFADGLEDYDLLKMVERKTSRAAALEILTKVYKSNSEVAVKGSAVTSFKKELLETLAK